MGKLGIAIGLLCFWAATLGAAPLADQDPAFVALRSLCDPAKLATLQGDRPANDRVRKITYWIETARREGVEPSELLDQVMTAVGWADERGRLTAAAIERNRLIAERLGCLDEAGMEKLRHGRAPVVQNGPYKEDVLSVDHIIPKSVVPELDTLLANLELMPMRLNRQKSDAVGERQIDFAQKLHSAGLLSDEGLQAVQQRLAERAESLPEPAQPQSAL